MQVNAGRGALLEVTVLGKTDRKPQPKVNVTAFKEDSQSPGRFRQQRRGQVVFAAGRLSGFVTAAQSPAGLRHGGGRQDQRVETELTESRRNIDSAPPQKISGVVRTAGWQARRRSCQCNWSADSVRAAKPISRPTRTENLNWNGTRASLPDKTIQTPCLLVRDVEHNLAVAQDLGRRHQQRWI